MEVILKAPQKIGNRSYVKGKHVVPDNLAHNLSFKALVKSGAIQMLPRDSAAQKIQMSRDVKAQQKSKHARKLALAKQKSHQSANAASSASPSKSNVAGSAQALLTPAKPIMAGAADVASVPAAPVTAQTKR